MQEKREVKTPWSISRDQNDARDRNQYLKTQSQYRFPEALQRFYDFDQERKINRFLQETHTKLSDYPKGISEVKEKAARDVIQQTLKRKQAAGGKKKVETASELKIKSIDNWFGVQQQQQQPHKKQKLAQHESKHLTNNSEEKEKEEEEEDQEEYIQSEETSSSREGHQSIPKEQQRHTSLNADYIPDPILVKEFNEKRLKKEAEVKAFKAMMDKKKAESANNKTEPEDLRFRHKECQLASLLRKYEPLLKKHFIHEPDIGDVPEPVISREAALESLPEKLLIGVTQIYDLNDELWLFGVTPSMATVAIELEGVRPFFYLSCPPLCDGNLALSADQLKSILNDPEYASSEWKSMVKRRELLQSKSKKSEWEETQLELLTSKIAEGEIVHIEIVNRLCGVTYQGRIPKPYFKISFANMAAFRHFRLQLASQQITELTYRQQLFHETHTLTQMFFNMTTLRLFDIVQVDSQDCNFLPASQWEDVDRLLQADRDFLESISHLDPKEHIKASRTLEHLPTLRKPECRTKAQLEGRCSYKILRIPEAMDVAFPILTAVFDIETLCWESVQKQRKSKTVPEFDDDIDEKSSSKANRTERKKEDVVEIYPFPKKPKDAVIYIATNFMVYGDKRAFLRVVHCLGKPKFDEKKDLQDAVVYTFDEDHEAEMLLHWSNMIQTFHVEWLAGYNSIVYDLPYVIQRAQVLNVPEVQSNFSRFLEMPHDRLRNWKRYRATQCAVKLMGQRFGQKKPVIVTPGLIQFDALKTVRQMINLDTYKLKEVANHYLKDMKGQFAKKDMPYDLISPFWAAGPEHQRRLAIYCYYDSLVTEQTIITAFFLTHAIEVAKATNTSVTQQMMQGQQIKNWNLIVRRTAEKWILDELLRQEMQQVYGVDTDVLPRYMTDSVAFDDREIVDWTIQSKESKSLKDREKQFEGATVLPPDKGFYEEPVATLDFSSLYPSIMIAFKLCFSTWIRVVVDRKTGKLWIPLYDKDRDHTMEGKLYLLWEPHLPKPANPNNLDLIMVCKSAGGLICCFVQNRECFFPDILREMLDLRNKVKKEQKIAEESGNKMLESILNARQLAIKVICNAAYGFTGASAGWLPAIPIAITTCFLGRLKILFVKTTAEQKIGGIVVYGDTDSVFIRFPWLQKQQKHLTKTEIHFQALYLAALVCEIVNNELPNPMNLEFEKMMDPLLLIQKKTYCGDWIWPKPYLLCKGTKNVRRDCSEWAKTCIGDVLKAVMKTRKSTKEIYEIIDRTLRVIEDPHIPLKLLQKTVAKKSTYKNDELAQAILFRKLKERRGMEVDEGTRVPYVFSLPNNGTRSRYKGEKMADCIEDVDYLIRNKIKVDRIYYVERQLQNTLVDYVGDVIVPKAEIIKRCQNTIKKIWQQDFGAATLAF